MNKNWIYKLLLILAAMIWGFAFVAQNVGMNHVGPYTFNAIRMPIASFTVWIYLLCRKKSNNNITTTNNVWIAGGLCGIFLFLASTLQQIGILYTTSGKAGFLTALYIILVPIFSIALGKKPSKRMIGCVMIALFGMYLLCIKEDFSINQGDLLEIGCAFLFSLHILTIDHYANLVDGVKMSCIQFLVCGFLSAICMIAFETVQLTNIIQAIIPILYAGVLSGGVAYTLQIIGQQHINPTEGSLLLSMESVFAAIGGFLLLHEKMSTKEVFGCIFLFAAIIITQLPEKKG